MWFWQRWKRDSDNLDKIRSMLESLLETSTLTEDQETKAELIHLNPSNPVSKDEIARKLSNSSNSLWEEDNLSEEEIDIFHA